MSKLVTTNLVQPAEGSQGGVAGHLVAQPAVTEGADDRGWGEGWSCTLLVEKCESGL